MTNDQAPSPTPTPAPSRRLPTGFATLRDAGTFLIGMAIIVNEVFFSSAVEPAAVALGVTMTGLPLVFGADERRKSNGGGDRPTGGPQ